MIIINQYLSINFNIKYSSRQGKLSALPSPRGSAVVRETACTSATTPRCQQNLGPRLTIVPSSSSTSTEY